LAYTLASAATVLTGAHSAQADIHYSGILDERFPKNVEVLEFFPLDKPGDSLLLEHTDGAAYVKILPFSAGSVAGYLSFDQFFASKLTFGRNLSTATFVSSGTFFALLASGGSGQWLEPGKGFIGFKFDGGSGPQYGWARIKMGGTAENNRFKLIDYAYADPGEPISTGQRSSLQEPGLGSLGYLAAGAIGLIAWRNRRRNGGLP
jgi:hypothetical protein